MTLDDAYTLADALGLVVDKFVLDGTWRRVPLVGKKKSSLNGAYCLSEITLRTGVTVVVGLLFNWVTGLDERLTLEGVEGATPDDVAEARKRAREAAIASQRAKVKLQGETAERALGIWEKLPDEGSSEYLKAKKVRAYGLRFSRGSIVLPACDVDGKIWTLQWINAEGGKLFLSGGAKRGRFCLIKKASAAIPYGFGVVEGYATGASVFEALKQGLDVAIAFDAGNLLPVGEALRSRYPDSVITFFADHDIHKGYPEALIRAREATPAVHEQVERLARLRPDVAVLIVADDDPRLSDRELHFNTGVTKALLAAAAVDGDVVVPCFGDAAAIDNDVNNNAVESTEVDA